MFAKMLVLSPSHIRIFSFPPLLRKDGHPRKPGVIVVRTFLYPTLAAKSASRMGHPGSFVEALGGHLRFTVGHLEGLFLLNDCTRTNYASPSSPIEVSPCVVLSFRLAFSL
jgi:hypothetical protein